MHIGIIAREFPPAVGGMEEVARQVAFGLAETDDVTVFTKTNCGTADATFSQQPVLSGKLWEDVARLRNEEVDVWLAMNAGYAAIAPSLLGTVWIYCHGNDFLSPTRLNDPWWDPVLRNSPYLWRYRKPLIMRWRQAGLRSGLSNVTGVIANSNNTASLFEKLYGRRPFVVPPGVHDRYFSNGPRNGATDGGKLRLLTVTRLSQANQRKNIDGVLHALSTLNGKIEFNYTIVGDGDDRSRLEALTKQLHLEQAVVFRGRVSDDDLLRTYRDADLFILASKADEFDVEGFGIVYLEACAAGTPVLCSRQGGAIDAVIDGETGILIERSDADAIAAGILRFLSLRDQLTAHKAQSFAENFRWTKVVQRIRAKIQDDGSKSRRHLAATGQVR